MVVFWDSFAEAQLRALATLEKFGSVVLKITHWSIMPGAHTLGLHQGNLRPTPEQANKSELKIHMESYLAEVDNIGLK